MSEVDKSGAQSEVISDDKEATQQIKTEDKVSYETHKRLLGEKKKMQAEYEAMKAELDKKQQAEMETKGEQTKLIDSLRKQLADKDKSLLEVKTNFTLRSLESSVIAEAVKQGCLDHELLLKAIDIQSIEINDDLTINQEDLKRAVADVAARKPLLFKKKVGDVKDGVPKVSKDDLRTEPDFSKLSLTDKIKKMAEISAQGGYSKRK